MKKYKKKIKFLVYSLIPLSGGTSELCPSPWFLSQGFNLSKKKVVTFDVGHCVAFSSVHRLLHLPLIVCDSK